MAEYGEGVAGDIIARLYSDVDRIHRNMPKYEPHEVLEWLTSMENELRAYAERMSSMMAAAVDEVAFKELCKNLQSSGFRLDRSEPLIPDKQSTPLAWALVASR